MPYIDRLRITSIVVDIFLLIIDAMDSLHGRIAS
jgi:hypothetical protein